MPKPILNKGKNTSAIEKKLWSTSTAKMKATLIVTDKHYKAKPLKRVFIEKKEKTKNGHSEVLPCMIGQCKPYMH